MWIQLCWFVTACQLPTLVECVTFPLWVTPVQVLGHKKLLCANPMCNQEIKKTADNWKLVVHPNQNVVDCGPNCSFKILSIGWRVERSRRSTNKELLRPVFPPLSKAHSVKFTHLANRNHNQHFWSYLKAFFGCCLLFCLIGAVLTLELLIMQQTLEPPLLLVSFIKHASIFCIT